MSDYIMELEPDGLRKALEKAKAGARILCPRCRHELIVAFDMDSAKLQRVHPGVYCPVNPAHVYVTIELRHPSGNLEEMIEARRRLEADKVEG